MKGRMFLVVILISTLVLPDRAKASQTAGLSEKPLKHSQTLSVFITIAAGFNHTCAITSAGGVKCWGLNYAGQLGDGTTYDHSMPVDVVDLESGVSQLAGGAYHTCALMTTGGVKCWGLNMDGELGNGTTIDHITPEDVPGLTSGVSQLASGSFHTCALLTTGEVRCWGSNSTGQLGDGTTTNRWSPVPVLGPWSRVIQLGAGVLHTCALTQSGGVLCWGNNSEGRLGDGTNIDHYTPASVTGLPNGVSQIAVGNGHTCALLATGAVKCWGPNYKGQLGNGNTTNQNSPKNVIGLGNGIVQIAAGGSHTCVVMTAGFVKCWGDNEFGGVGDGTTNNRYTPVNVVGLTGEVTQLVAGGGHTCVLSTLGGIKCWGFNGDGQLGNGTTIYRTTPVDVVGLANEVVQLTSGDFHTCVLTATGGVKCWGKNTGGLLGDGSTILKNKPVDVVGLSNGVIQLSAGNEHTCALTTIGGVKCWGNNVSGELGDGTTIVRTTPVDVIGLSSGVIQVAAGGYHTCALTNEGGVKCWGNNWDGELGNGTIINQSVPVDVFGLSSGVSQIAGGGDSTCAALTVGGVKCWGENRYGQLGDGTTISRHTPVNVMGYSYNVKQLAAGLGHVCVLSEGGGIKCWGYNDHGQLGDGTTTDRSMPVNVLSFSSGINEIAAGTENTCALTTNGGLTCWGYNWAGSLGNGTTSDSSTPAQVVGLASGVGHVAPGNYHTCAVTINGRVKCWGWDLYGQLGLGTQTYVTKPVDVIERVPAHITLNYSIGQPGSFVTIIGDHFTPSIPVTIAVNSQVMTNAVPVVEDGSFILFINTTTADPGGYWVSAISDPNNSASALLIVDQNAPLRSQEGGGQTLNIPSGIAFAYHLTYLPITER
jgi:alpha-tubulin suppressor-like RCC1 family protein